MQRGNARGDAANQRPVCVTPKLSKGEVATFSYCTALLHTICTSIQWAELYRAWAGIRCTLAAASPPSHGGWLCPGQHWVASGRTPAWITIENSVGHGIPPHTPPPAAPLAHCSVQGSQPRSGGCTEARSLARFPNPLAAQMVKGSSLIGKVPQSPCSSAGEGQLPVTGCTHPLSC